MNSIKKLLWILLLLGNYGICQTLDSDLTHPTVAIAEVLYDSPLNEVITKPNYSHGEFISFLNYGNEQVDLSAWRITDGGKETFIFPSGTILMPQSLCIVAFRGSKNKTFRLDSVYTNAREHGWNLLLYQDKLILANGGETLVLQDANGRIIDAMTYDGTSKAPDSVPTALRAPNASGLNGDKCVSLQRINVKNNPALRSDFVKKQVKAFAFAKEIALNSHFFTVSDTCFRVSNSIVSPLDAPSGDYQVTSSGAFSYDIPIQIPTGIDNFTPQLSLSYNSQNSTGLLGVGFSLSGLSQINREGALFHYDRQGSSSFDDSVFRFSLNGQRLELISGSYGKNNSQYEIAEQPSFIQIIYTERTLPGFTVRSKDGVVCYYGGNENALIKDGNGKIYAYLLREVCNANGLSILYRYNTQKGRAYLSQIEYGRISLKMYDSEVFPIAAVVDNPSTLIDSKGSVLLKFSYEKKAGNYSILNGERIWEDSILHSISCIVHNQEQSSYRFTYRNLDSHFPLLKKVEKTYMGNPLPPVVFEWTGETNLNPRFVAKETFTEEIRDENGNIKTEISNMDVCFLGDFNGDGKSDVLLPQLGIYTYRGNGKWEKILHANPEENSTLWSYVGREDVAYFVYDVNQDGLDDVLVCHKGGTSVFINGGEKNTAWASQATFEISKIKSVKKKVILGHNFWIVPQLYFGDFDGDGSIEIFTSAVLSSDDAENRYATWTQQIYSHENGQYQLQQQVGSISKKHGSFDLVYFIIADLDNDGKDEVVRVHQALSVGSDPVHPDVRELLGVGFYDNLDQSQPEWTLVIPWGEVYSIIAERGSAGERYHISLQDMNADGYPDLVVMSEKGIEVFENGGEERTFGIKGKSLEVVNATFTTDLLNTKGQWKNSEENPVLFIDMNQDGLPDILALGKENTHWIQNTGGHFSSIQTEEVAYSSDYSRLFGNFDGDNDIDLLLIPKKGQLKFLLYEHETKGTPKITTIREGWNKPPLHIEYGFSQRENGRKETYNQYPIVQLNQLEVVARTYRQSGDEIRDKNEYRYMDGLYHKGKSAFLGFSKIERISPQGHSSLSEYGLNADKSMLFPQKEETPFSLKTYEYGWDTSYYGKTYWTLKSTQSVDKLTNTQERLWLRHDRYGNLASETHRIGSYDGQKKLIWESEEETQSEYASYGSWNVPNACIKKITRCGYIGKPSLADTAFMDYDKRGRLILSKNRIGTTRYDYNSTGLLRNQTFVSTAHPNACLRKSFEYTSDHRFIKAVSDTTGTQTYHYDSISGLLLKQRDIRGRATSYEYDKLGYLIQKTDPDGYKTLYKKDWATSAHPVGACLFVEEKNVPGVTSQTYYDKWGNEIGTSKTIGNTRSFTRKIYDQWSRLVGLSEPAFSTEGGMLHLYEYDTENRLKKETFGKRITEYQYYDLVSSVRKPDGITHIEQRNHTGDVVHVWDFVESGENADVSYEYSYPEKMSAISNDGITTKMTYDSRGRQISLDDPSAGKTTFTYNENDDLVWSTDAEGIVSSYTYDPLGRETEMKIGDAKVDFRYGEAGNEKDLLVEKTLNNGSRISYQYDQAGRLTTKTLYNGSDAYTFTYDYDSFGRIAQLCYPNRYCVYYGYDEQGNVVQITDNLAHVLFKNPQYDAHGRITSYEFGDGLHYEIQYNDYGRVIELAYKKDATTVLYGEKYTFDSAGQNLISRTFMTQEMFPESDDNTSTVQPRTDTEFFKYDDWGRLIFSCIGNDSLGIHIQYDKNGNILSKSDVGDYGYYPDKPYAVNGIGVKGELGYLSERLLTQRIKYTPFKQINEITQQRNDNGKAKEIKSSFSYNPDLERMTMERSLDGVRTTTNFYFDDYEKKQNDGKTVEYCYVLSPVGLLGIHTTINPADSQQFYHVASDYMNSIRAIMTRDGSIVERFEFDPWGKRRNPVTHKSFCQNEPVWNLDSPHLAISLLERGFCGQEHMDEFDLINLNARLYDPILGRFLNPDPFLQDYKNIQNLNRYSYALNNPFNYTDPTGNFIEPMSWVMVGVMAVIGGITNVAIHSRQTTHLWQDFALFGIGAFMGAASSFAGIGLAGVTSANGFAWGALAGGLGGAAVGAVTSPLQTVLNNITLNNPFDMNLGKQVVSDIILGFLNGFISGGVQGALAAKAQGLRWFDGTLKYTSQLDHLPKRTLMRTSVIDGECYHATACNVDKLFHPNRTDEERKLIYLNYLIGEGNPGILPKEGSFVEVASVLGLNPGGLRRVSLTDISTLKTFGENISYIPAVVEYIPGISGEKPNHFNNTLSLKIRTRTNLLGKTRTSFSIRSWDSNLKRIIHRYFRSWEINKDFYFYLIH
ncbi:MAG: FG-GAP-like repeat-containing protein [Bacteroides sp.]|nr:FG-GAP-like repeat-containing protein [Ruminococcus flavefaciens]MCM1554770.1 FG-GAP-like repeat-containing protein [Bacteroides sp.]